MMAAIGMPKRAAVLLLLVTSAAGAPGDSSSDDSTNVYCDECGASATYFSTGADAQVRGPRDPAWPHVSP